MYMRRILTAALLAAAVVVCPARATLTTVPNTVTYSGNGSTTAFATVFPFLQASDLVVTVAGVTKNLNVDFTVSGAGNATGTVTFTTAPANLASVVITRTVDYQQKTSLKTSRTYDPATVEKALDKLAMGEQQLQALYTNPPATVLPAQVTAKLNGIRFADQFANIQAAITDAGTTGAVLIPSSYAATDSFTNPNAIPIIDLRGGPGRWRGALSVMDFGAKGDGIADDTSAIQAALTAAVGHRVLLPRGQYAISSGLTIAATTTLEGESSSSSDTSNTSTLLYSGTAAALTVGVAGGQIKNVRLSDFQIKATGSATSSGTAVGLKLINANQTLVSNIAVQGFGGGIGITATATTGQVGATNTFLGCFLYNNLVGYKFDGFDATHGDYASTIVGGTVIGITSGTAGSKCLYVTQYSANLTVYGTDFETAQYPIDLDGNGSTNGGSVRLIGTRTEFHGIKQIRINATADHTLILGHRFTGGVAADQLSDSGTNTFRLDPDAAVSVTPTSLRMLNNIGITMRDVGGTDRTVFKLANNDTTQIGTTYGGFNGNFAQGAWIFSSTLQLNSVTQANLGTPANGTLLYCSDCNTASACTAGGTGALASRQNGAWKCL